MSAYMVFTRDKTLDQGEMDVCAKAVPASIPGHELKPSRFMAHTKTWKSRPPKARLYSSSRVWPPPKRGTTARSIAKPASIASKEQPIASLWWMESEDRVRVF